MNEGVILGEFYNDRGDLAAWDFQMGDLTIDGAAHALSLVGIIPTSAYGKRIRLRANLTNNTPGERIQIRKNGHVNWINSAQVHVQTNGIAIDEIFDIMCDNLGSIEYLVSNAGVWTKVNLVVLGWWD